ncbi:hypothetical protein [Nonomuraea gerenzanensis]|uniref:hypothetical protein n=1 Tax=Nonomuraea gerenzanensis TaxID=93944 RepID=UPI001CD9AB0E|nr:hypothetical protein [Nonomuraea gerenzanensis]UBU11500.1 hypothetical protein LCN96_45490 [Nonomuraea gerenzanensis]
MVGLVLLSLIALMSIGAVGEARGGGSAVVTQASVGQMWVPGGEDADLSSLPPQAGNMREHHVLSLWRPLRGSLPSEPAHLALMSWVGSDADLLRDPQQLAHRIAGSRSPPIA